MENFLSFFSEGKYHPSEFLLVPPGKIVNLNLQKFIAECKVLRLQGRYGAMTFIYEHVMPSIGPFS